MKELLTKVGKAHTAPSHAEDGDGEATKIDYSALPMLPQYQCRSKDGPSTGGNDATVPAKTTAPGRSNKDRAATGGLGVKGAGGNTAAEPESTGKLPPEVIQRVVRASYGTFRKCYEEGLTRNENLGGRVGVRFVIERDGSVSRAVADCPTLPDPAVIDCVVKAFGALRFPKPSGGFITVIYPIMYTPED
jgi:hypothetical protein